MFILLLRISGWEGISSCHFLVSFECLFRILLLSTLPGPWNATHNTHTHPAPTLEEGDEIPGGKDEKTRQEDGNEQHFFLWCPTRPPPDPLDAGAPQFNQENVCTTFHFVYASVAQKCRAVTWIKEGKNGWADGRSYLVDGMR